MRFEVQTWSMFGGWQNSWTDDARPVTFASYLEAEAELNAWVEQSLDIAENYRIVEIANAEH